MGKTKQVKEKVATTQVTPMLMTTIYKPIPKFKSGCKNC